jgi:hypothetical protein
MTGLGNVALFYFVAGATVAVFAFLSIAHWLSRYHDHVNRDRDARVRGAEGARQRVESSRNDWRPVT